MWTTIQQYKDRWADEPGETQRERAARESAVSNIEASLREKGMQFIEGERVDIARVGDAVARSNADIENTAKAIVKTMRTRFVDPEEVADQLVTLKREVARNRKIIADLVPRQEANERNAEDPVAYMERLYERNPMIRNPLGDLPGFRTDVDRAEAIHEDQEKRRPRNPVSETEKRAKRSRVRL